MEKGFLNGPDWFEHYKTAGFKTPTKKVKLALSQAEKFVVFPLPQFKGLPGKEDTDYPLVLTSCKSRHYLHSSYRWLDKLRKHRPYPKTEIHTDTGARYGIRDGDEVIIETKKGEIMQVVRLTDTVHPKAVNAAYGWWWLEDDLGSDFKWKRSNYNLSFQTESGGNSHIIFSSSS